MIKSITVTNYRGDSIKLELARPELSGFAVEEIQGLGPGKAEVSIKELATMHGGRYNSAKLSSRNIVLSLIFLDKPTIEDTRHRSYRYFPLMKKVKLTIENGNRVAEIEGIVESNEPTIFSKGEGTSISILCEDPFFYSSGDTGTKTVVFNSVEPVFEFPFSNESLESNTIEFSVYSQDHSATIVYEGDSEVGMIIRIRAVGPASGIKIWNADTKETMEIDTEKLQSLTGSGFITGDEIVINTLDKQKAITLIRDGKTTNILNCLSKYADWFKLSKGDNNFLYSAADGVSNLQFEISHRIIYEGV